MNKFEEVLKRLDIVGVKLETTGKEIFELMSQKVVADACGRMGWIVLCLCISITMIYLIRAWIRAEREDTGDIDSDSIPILVFLGILSCLSLAVAIGITSNAITHIIWSKSYAIEEILTLIK